MDRSQAITDGIVRGFKEFVDAVDRGDKITEKFTCRKVELRLRPIPYSPKDVVSTRKKLGVSQAIFAQFLGVKPSCVQSWEQGRQTPHPMAGRFMDEIRANPKYWQRRLRMLLQVKEGC